MRKLSIVVVFSLVAVNQFAAASNPPSHLTCNVTRTDDGFFTYTLIPAPTVTEHSSTSWANGTDHVFAHDHNFSALVRNITRNSVTLKWCEEDIFFMHNGETQQEARCHVNCSLYATLLPPPSDNHIFCLSDHWCPPVWAVVLLFLVLVLVLALVVVLVWCKMKGSRCRDRRLKKGKEIYKFVKNGAPADSAV